MEEKKAHDLAVVMAKGIMGKDFREETEEQQKQIGKWQWVGPNYGDRSKGDIWATCSICNSRVCIKTDDMGCCPNCHAEMDVEKSKEKSHYLFTSSNEKEVDNFVEAVCSIFDNLKETFRRKNQQYATADPLANFRTGAYMRTGRADYADMYEEAKNYQRKHIAHVQNNEINGSKVDESLIDIAVYAVLMKYMYDRHYDNVIAE